MAFCECGCGQDAGVYAATVKIKGGIVQCVRGDPKRYVKGHSNNGRRSTHCKCGLPRTLENTNASGYCKACSNAAQTRWRELHPHAERGKHYPSRYGVSKEQFDAQCEMQGNRCAICSVEFDYSRRETTPNLDHKHDITQKFRGVLCHCCNTGLGMLGDSIQNLRSAIQYLEKTQ